jgi:hypothetical protein
MDMIARLLALHLVRDQKNDQAVAQLGVVGFTDKAVSELLGIPESSVRVIRFRSQKKQAKKSKGV